MFSAPTRKQAIWQKARNFLVEISTVLHVTGFSITANAARICIKARAIGSRDLEVISILNLREFARC